MHLRTLVRRACTQPSRSVARAAPRLRERAVAGTVLQADGVEAVVAGADVGRVCGEAQRCVVAALPIVACYQPAGVAEHSSVPALSCAAAQ